MTQPASLAGRVALVTGAGRGIGQAIAAEFVRRGAKVIVADAGVSIAGENPDPGVAQRAAAELGANTVAFERDIAAPGAAQAAVAAALEHFGALDMVVNNAAILRDAFIFKSERANWEKVIETNLTGAYACLAAATPAMRDAVKQGRAPGRIVNIVSSAALYGNFGQSAYASSKAGLVALTRVVALDMARSGVNCNALAPFAATRVTESIQPANEAQAEYKRRALTVPAGYVARVVAWLCSAGCNVTGQLFGVRGRELFLFSQPRPAVRTLLPPGDAWSDEALARAVRAELAPGFTDLTTDLEAFNTEPIL